MVAIVRVVVVSVALALATPIDGKQRFRPEIPKVWDESMLTSMELPLAAPAPRVEHVSAAWYYSIPEVVIYKSYPIAPASKSPDDYVSWLGQQQPEIAFDASRLTSESDWVAAGRVVFETSLDPEPVSTPLAEGMRNARYVVREKGRVERTTGCGECHNDGDTTPRDGPSYLPLGSPRALTRFSLPWLKPDPNMAVPGLDRSSSRGVAIRWGGEPQFPMQVPDLVGIKDRRYLDHTGLHRHRSIGDIMRYAAMASGYGMERYRRYGAFIPAGLNQRELPDPQTLRRFSDEQLYALALYIYSLEPPPNPHKPDAFSDAGGRIFQREGCGSCHTPPLYTNNKLIPADGFDVPAEHLRTHDILQTRIGVDPWLAIRSRRGTGYYKVPSLRGVWRRQVIEHRGSVATLEDWFDAARLRADYVPTGFKGPTERRAVRGHEFGLRLSTDDRRALVAFLRTL